jgi:hypothetical protein
MRAMAILAIGSISVLVGCGHAPSDDTGGGSGGNGGAHGGVGSAASGGGGTQCLPSCGGRQCGDDGCGGVCGGCGADQLCSAAGACAAVSGAALVVDAAAGVHPIHPEVYGLAGAPAATLTALRIPLNRWGGDSSTLYNWKLDVANHATWWYYENIPGGSVDGFGTPGKNPGDAGFVSSSDGFVMSNQSAGAATLMTIPTIGWAPKDRHGAPYTCGFPASKYGAGKVGQQGSIDSPDCGNAEDGAGNIIPSIVPDPTNDSVAVGPDFEGQWVQHLVDTFGDAGAGGVRFYQLDNEMMLWPSTHHDIRANPVDSDEVWSATLSYAPAIKAVDPKALVLGYTAWYASDLYISGKDAASGTLADQQAHGGIPLARWYLQKLKQYEDAHGQRLVDCLDFHYYPQGGDVLENTRSLWDPTYRDPSWYDSWSGGKPMALLPTVLGWIQAEYPGTQLCVSEYNWNNDDPSNPVAGLAEADVLGLFGKYGVRLAAFWTTPGTADAPAPAWRAFQLYRNADGQGHGFGDTSVAAASMLPKVALYAALDSATGNLTLMVINKDTTALTQALALRNFAAGARAKVYQVVLGSDVTRPADYAVTGGAMALNVPARAMQLIVVPKQ